MIPYQTQSSKLAQLDLPGSLCYMHPQNSMDSFIKPNMCHPIMSNSMETRITKPGWRDSLEHSRGTKCKGMEDWMNYFAIKPL